MVQHHRKTDATTTFNRCSCLLHNWAGETQHVKGYRPDFQISNSKLRSLKVQFFKTSSCGTTPFDLPKLGNSFPPPKKVPDIIYFSCCVFTPWTGVKKNMTNPNNALITGKKTSNIQNKPCIKLWILPKIGPILVTPWWNTVEAPATFDEESATLPSSPGHRSFLPAPTQLAKRSCRTQVAAEPGDLTGELWLNL